jgi:hypothetical protein
MGERLTGDTWAKAFSSFRRSAFRWEAQGVYREPYEQEPLRQFLAGHEPDTAFVQGWLDEVRANSAAGRRYSRVRVLTEPLTDYLRFELALTPLNVEAGEEVRLLPDTRRRQLDLPGEDFWLFDDEWVALMRFGPDGFEYAEVITDFSTVQRFREIRALAWREATPFS